MGLSRNKVAVPEGAAGTTPFWRVVLDAARPERSEGQDHQRTSPLTLGLLSTFLINEIGSVPSCTVVCISIASTPPGVDTTIFDILTQNDCK